MADPGESKKDEADYKRMHSFPLIRIAAGETLESSHIAYVPPAVICMSAGGMETRDILSPAVAEIIHDMPEEMRVETMELCVTACEKFASNNESAAKMIKETMDKKFGSSWHVVIGEGFGFEITHEVKNLLYMFFGGSLAICVWKCS